MCKCHSSLVWCTHHWWTGPGGSPAWCPLCPRPLSLRPPRPRGCCAWRPWPPRCSCSSAACPRCWGAPRGSLRPPPCPAQTRPQRAWECHSGDLTIGGNVKLELRRARGIRQRHYIRELLNILLRGWIF